MGFQPGTIQFGPNKAYSRGLLRLRSADPRREPLVAFNLLSDPRDLQRTINAVHFVYDALHTSPASDMIYFTFPGIYAEMQRNLTTQSRRNKILGDLAAWLLDLGAFARDFIMRNFIVAAKHGLDEVMRDENLLVEWIRLGVQGDWHACGTCKMGAHGSNGGGRPRCARARRRELARRGRIDHAVGALRQHEHLHHHDRREDREYHSARQAYVR